MCGDCLLHHCVHSTHNIVCGLPIEFSLVSLINDMLKKTIPFCETSRLRLKASSVMVVFVAFLLHLTLSKLTGVFFVRAMKKMQLFPFVHLRFLNL